MRRDLLSWHRNRWEKRAAQLAELVTWYQGVLDAIEREAAALDAAEMYASAQRTRAAGAGPGASVPELRDDLGAAGRKLKYARARARSLTEDLGPRASACQKNQRWIRCACEDGAARPVDVDCRQRTICEGCRKRWAGKMRRRILDAAPRWIEKMSRGRYRARVRMITLTVAHSGDLARDREDLVKGWEGLRKQLHKWFGEALPFCMVWETTQGTDGLGHEHAHVIVVGGPGWWNYSAIQRTWRNVCRRSSHLDIQTAKGDQAKSASRYLSKYATKGVSIGSSWPDRLIAQWIACHYGKRWISTSLGFWAPPEPICRHCGERCRRAKPPGTWAATIDSREGMLVRRNRGENTALGP